MPERDIASLRPHEATGAVPAMPGSDYRDLLADIRAHGVRVPLDILPDGRVLDGRSRLRACIEAGIQRVPVRELDLDEHDAVSHILRTAVLRRHLTPSQRAALVARGEEMLAQLRAEAVQRQRAGVGATLPQGRGRVKDHLAPLAHVSPRLMQDVLTAREDPEVFAEVLAGRLPAHRAAARVRQQRARASARAKAVPLPDLALVHQGDFRRQAHLVPDGSVDLILTDPPYDRRSLPLYADLAEFAARKLRAGGSLLCYVPGYAMPDVLRTLAARLDWCWLLAEPLHDKDRARLDTVGVSVWHLPIAWLTRGKRHPFRSLPDVLPVKNVHEHDLHDYQKHEGTARYLIEQLTDPGAFVVDPFCGSGTTLTAAVRLGRRAVGFEIDPETAAVAGGRLVDLAEELAGLSPIGGAH